MYTSKCAESARLFKNLNSNIKKYKEVQKIILDKRNLSNKIKKFAKAMDGLTPEARWRQGITKAVISRQLLG
jgi:hypothetical protein